MSLSVRCPNCGTSHKAPDNAAGKTAPCLACGTRMTIPSAPPIDPAAILLQDDEAPTPTPEPPPEPRPGPVFEERSAVPRKPSYSPSKKAKTIDVTSLPPLTSNDPPVWRRHLHWLLVLALLPLVIMLLAGKEEKSFGDRLEEYMEQASPEEQVRIIALLKSSSASIDDLFAVLPEHRFPGAFLSHSSMGHWLMAAIAIIAYMTFFMFLASDGSAKPLHVLLVGLFTATIGVGFLLLVQALASATEGHIYIGVNVVAILFLVLKFIAFSYNAAMSPENGFFLSFVGFTFGVGLCEEFVKAIPLFWHRSTESGRTWRGLLIWGLASGAGFGIAEGIMYSSRYYNGISGPGTYVVRFLSCVALHAIWSGSVAILLYLRRDLFDGLDRWFEWIFPIIFVIGVPAILHGLYDTCLKRDMNGVALLAAFASFGYLAFLTSRLQSGDDEAAHKEMLREYQRRKKAMA